MLLTIAVLTYNGEHLLPDCLSSIEHQTYGSDHTEYLLVDNGSDRPVNAAAPWRVYRTAKNVGNIGGQNVCMEQAQGEFVLFVANDVRLHPRMLEQLWTCAGHGRVVQPILLTPGGLVDNGGLTWTWPGYGLSIRDFRHTQMLLPIDAFTGSCYLMPKALWQVLGGFDEHLVSSHEDIDFSLRLQKIDGRCYCATQALATHLGNATLRHTLTDHKGHFHRARRQVIAKHYAGWDKWSRLTVESLGYVTAKTLEVIRPRR